MARMTLPLALLIMAVLLPLPGRAVSSITLKSVNVNLPDDSEMFTGSGEPRAHNTNGRGADGGSSGNDCFVGTMPR